MSPCRVKNRLDCSSQRWTELARECHNVRSTSTVPGVSREDFTRSETYWSDFGHTHSIDYLPIFVIDRTENGSAVFQDIYRHRSPVGNDKVLSERGMAHLEVMNAAVLARNIATVDVGECDPGERSSYQIAPLG